MRGLLLQSLGGRAASLLGGEGTALAAVKLSSFAALGGPALVEDFASVHGDVVDFGSVRLGVRDGFSAAAEVVTTRRALGDHFFLFLL